MASINNQSISYKTYSDNIENTEYWHCTFRCVVFLRVNFTNCKFYNCIFARNVFEDCAFINCSFHSCTLIESSVDILNTTSSKNPTVIFSKTHFYATDLHIENTKRIKLIQCTAYSIGAPNEILSYFFPLACPETGSFIAYKIAQIVTLNKTSNDCTNIPVIIKLLIPEDAKRSSAQTSKCRANKAKVLEITDLNGNQYTQAESLFYPCLYKLNETIEIDNFNEDRWEECAEGIHFFLTKEEAINYYSEHIPCNSLVYE